ncbi:MAG: hypothetical protein ACRDWS_00640 [Acidimicrobiia bacterium]
MAKYHSPRYLIGIAILGLLAVIWAGFEATRTAPVSEPGGTVGIEHRAPLTPAQQALVDFGLGRFADQGLDLPAIHIEFSPTVADCRGHEGQYANQSRTLRMCSLDKTTMLHELAHAWANHNLSTAEREAFAAFRGLAAWNDQLDEWKERGTEQAAEIIAWALLDEPNTVRFIDTEDDGTPKVSFRLLAIENSSVEALHEGFVELTGMEPIFRTPADWDSRALEAGWQARMSRVVSPEAAGFVGQVP